MYEQEMIQIPFEKENPFPSHQENSKMSDDQILSIAHFLKPKLTFKK